MRAFARVSRQKPCHNNGFLRCRQRDLALLRSFSGVAKESAQTGEIQDAGDSGSRIRKYTSGSGDPSDYHVQEVKTQTGEAENARGSYFRTHNVSKSSPLMDLHFRNDSSRNISGDAAIQRPDSPGKGPSCFPLLAPSYSIAELDAIVKRDRTSILDIRDFLNKARARLQRLPRSEQRNAAAEGNIGSKCLQWLWGNRLETLNQDINQKLAEDLCWFVHAEGRVGFIDQWIDIAAQDLTDAKAAEVKPRHHESEMGLAYVLAAQINAELLWSTDGTANAALMYLFDKQRDLHKAGLGRSISYVPSVARLQCFLQTDWCRPVKEEHFRWFSNFFLVTNTTEAGAMKRAELLLYHPSAPQPTQFFEFMTRRYSDTGDRRLEISRLRTERRLGHAMLRAVYILRLQGQSHNANTLEGILKDNHPRAWSAREKTYQDLRADPKLRLLHQESEMLD